MLNYQRRKRQAKENSFTVVRNFDEEIRSEHTLYPGIYHLKDDHTLMDLITKVGNEVRRKAENIEPDWSIPIILEAITQMYYGNLKKHIEYGPIFKRALVYLWDINTERMNSRKNLESLMDVLRLSYVIETLYGFRKFFLVDKDFSFTMENGYVFCDPKYDPMIQDFAALIQGRGQRMRIAEVNSELMCEHVTEFRDSLASVLDGQSPDTIPLFKGTFYEKIPGISDKECQRFWQALYFRDIFFIAITMEPYWGGKDLTDLTPEISLFPELPLRLPENFLTQEIVQDTFWTKDWMKSQSDERYSSLIVERPLLRITPGGDYATSSALIGDSVNYFIEEQIMDYPGRSPRIVLPPSVFKEAVSEPFENRVISEFRKNGFLAGHVTEGGIWLTQSGNMDLNFDDTKLYGEIDTLAFLPGTDVSILIECKVLNDIRDYRSYRNMISKLMDDSEGFQAKLLKKSSWIDQALSTALGMEISSMNILLTDIPLPVVDFPADNILFTWYDRLFALLNRLFRETGYTEPLFSDFADKAPQE